MKLFIAEKPSLARAIADNLDDTFIKKEGYLEGKHNSVTWCYGHILELCTPEDYKPEWKTWKKEDLPIIIQNWCLKPKASAAGQLNVIKSLLREAAEIIHAGDPDREGQLLVDEVLDYCHSNMLPVKRLWLASLDSRSVKTALNSMKDNSNYKNLSNAALARSRADWLVGINATRAMSILGREAGYTSTLSQGRVQTPTLNLIVTRDRERDNFVPINYYIVQAEYSAEDDDKIFSAKFIPSEKCPGLDSEGRLIDINIVKSLVKTLYQDIKITGISKEEKKQECPLPYSLSALQIKASAMLGMSAQEVLDAAQQLYEKKLISYPRSDCQYLPEEQYNEAHRILPTLAFFPQIEQYTRNADLKLKSQTWNTSKVTAHHAIIPTGEMPQENLKDKELQIYLLIAQRYIMQFFPVYIYEKQSIEITMDNTLWRASGRKVVQLGWRELQKDKESEEEKEQSLPDLSENSLLTCVKITDEAKKTSPPSAFTEGKLIEAMANIHRFVEDKEAKNILKENEGIGTEATRAGIIEILKTREFIKAEGKNLKSTELGQKLIDLTPCTLKNPVTTAQWESRLNAISQGQDSLDAFMSAQVALLPELLKPLLVENATFPAAYPCSQCGKPMKRITPKDKEAFWSCSGYPETCKHTQPDRNGKPGEKLPPQISEYKCTNCGKGLIRKKSQKGNYYWSCSGYPDCKSIFYDNKGKPQYN